MVVAIVGQNRRVLLLTLMMLGSASAQIPPVAHWEMTNARYQDGKLHSSVGPDLYVSGFPKDAQVDRTDGLRLDGQGDELTLFWNERAAWASMPKRDFTVSVKFSLNSAKGVQGVIGCIFQPESGLTGWRIVTRDGKPEFTLASRGEKAANAEATIRSAAALAPNTLHHAVASYDGRKIHFYIDGNEVGQQPAAFGDVVYNGRAGVCFGGWWEGPRSYRFEGFVSQASLFDRAATPDEVVTSAAALVPKPMPNADSGPQRFTVAPYFVYPTAESVTVMWETTRSSPSKVSFGPSTQRTAEITGNAGRLHEVELKNLAPATTYFVRVDSSLGGEKAVSEWSSFRTASLPGAPVKFAVVGDTQDQPAINRQIGDGMFAARPDFALIVGDLVGTGWLKSDWTDAFFGSMRPMLSHVPLLPVLGNHERNARLYYDHFALPEPEYYYTYQTGDVQIWVVDTEHDVSPGSVQYKWLEKELAASKAIWKIVAHHYPPYSSDLDDYGNAARGPILGGDLSVRPLTKLYDKYGVDLCFSGHIHSYERTQPLRDGKFDPSGTVYLVVGGGGGGLEQFAPTHHTFSHTVRTGHHYGMVWADRTRLEFRAYDIDRRLFDSFELRK